MNKIKGLLGWLFASKIKAGVVIILILALGFFGYRNFAKKTQAPTYQTAQAEKGSLITDVSASGNILSGNSIDITTTATGVITNVYVKNGDTVAQGEKIADVALDQASQSKLASAYSSYLSAKTSLDAAQAKINSLQATEFTANQKLINDAVARGLAANDPTYIEENATWLQAEADYKNQQSVISQAQAALNSASLSLSQISSTITAPAPGTVSNLILTPGLPISAPTSTTTSSVQKLGTIIMEQQGGLEASVNLSEVDAPKVNAGQKVTLTLDAFPDKTFTGHVGSVNTTGVVSSGVTTYPAIIALDSGATNIYPNMATTAKIITSIKNNVILVPTSAVQTQNGQSVVRTLQKGKEVDVPVELGDSNDTQTAITSGINEGQEVITGVTGSTAGRAAAGGATSPFGALGGGCGLGGVGGVGAVFLRGD